MGVWAAAHHAVWHAPDERPYPEPKDHPLPRQCADILFLVDDKALPVQTNHEEQEKCR